MKISTLLTTAFLSVAIASPVFALPDTHEEVLESAELLLELSQSPETQIPPELIRNSEAVAVITNVKEGGFILGGRRGDGVMIKRQSDGTWSNPAFINLSGGSVGLQAGFQSSDLVLLFPSKASLSKVLSGDFELGGSVSGTAGPIGKSAVESLEGFNDAVYVYSRSDGLFGGVSLEGSELSFDEDDNREFYSLSSITAKDIFLDTKMTAPVVVDSLKSVLSRVQ